MSIPPDPPLPPDLAEWLSTPGAPVAGYVRGLLGQIERLTAERSNFLAPVEGVDVEEVLQRAARRTALMEQGQEVEAQDDEWWLLNAAPALAREVVRLRAQTERLRTRLDVMETERNEARDRLADARADHLDAVDSARRAQEERDQETEARQTWMDAKARETAALMAANRRAEAAERERDAERDRHEAARVRLEAVQGALRDAVGSAPSVTDPPNVWRLAIGVAAAQGRAEGAPNFAGMEWMDDVKIWRRALLRLVGGRTDHLCAMFGQEIAHAAVAWGGGDSARWDNLSAPEQAHWVADYIERAAMIAADKATP